MERSTKVEPCTQEVGSISNSWLLEGKAVLFTTAFQPLLASQKVFSLMTLHYFR